MANPATIARPYDRPVFEIAGEDDTVDAWARMLDRMAALVAIPAVDAAIGAPEADRGVIAGILAEAGGDAFDDRGRTLLRVLADHRRLRLLPWIVRQYEDRRAAAERRVAARVVAAQPVSPAEQTRLRASLETSLGRAVRLECSVDSGLVAGAVIRIGDRVMDGSLSGRLRELAQHLA